MNSISRKAEGLIIMCDSTNPQSLKDSLKFKKVFDDYFTFEDGNKIPSMLVESKVDLLAKEEQMMKKLKNLLKKWI